MEVVLIVVVRVFPVCLPEVWQFMNISTFGTDDFTKYTILLHRQRVHFIIVIATVFEDEAVLTGLFRQVNQFPALFKVHCWWNFDCSMLTIFHRTLGYREVVVPVSSNVNEVDVITLAEFFITLFARINSCRSQTYLAEEILWLFCTFCFIVTKSHNFYTRDVAETHHCPRATHTQTHESNTYCLDRSSCQAQHMFLTCRTCRSVNHNGTLVPMPLSGWWQRLSTYCLKSHCQHRNQSGGKKSVQSFHFLVD